MTYFSRFPLIPYSFDNGVSYTLVSDVLRRISINKETKQNYSIIEEYQIQDGDTPETVSFKFYNDSQYHWIILILNDIIDPRFDWPLTETQLYDYAYNKYTGNINGIKHYTISETNDIVIDSTQVIDNTYPEAYEVKNLEYESKLNEEKRTIKILRPKFLNAFLTEFEALING